MATFYPINKVIVKPNRQRQEFDTGDLNELGESISQRGLLHAVVVRLEGDDVVLVAGERRLRAITDIYELGGTIKYGGVEVPAGMLPCVPLGELSELEAEEAELEENIRRVDLTWQERAATNARLAALRGRQAQAAGKPAPTVADIAAEVKGLPPGTPSSVMGGAHTTVRDQIIVANHLADPEVAAASSLKDAMKILKKREETRQNEELAARVGATFSSKSHSLQQTDCIPWLNQCPDGLFDIILTDPPYGMGADEFGDSGQSAEAHFYDDSYENWLRLFDKCDLPGRLFRVAKPNAHAYLFCDFDRFHELKQLMQGAGWVVHRTPLVWHNTDGFRVPWPDKGPQRQYELILYAVKGDKKTTRVAKDVLAYPRDKSLGHPAQKPVALLEDLLRRSATPTDEVLDVCAGSGATIEACHNLKLRCTALEADAASYGIAVKRLQSLSATDDALF